jgi:hypothetical protein
MAEALASMQVDRVGPFDCSPSGSRRRQAREAKSLIEVST